MTDGTLAKKSVDLVLCCWCWCFRTYLRQFGGWGKLEILNLNFVLSKILGWRLIKILKQKFGRNSEAEFWCYFKSVTLVKWMTSGPLWIWQRLLWKVLRYQARNSSPREENLSFEYLKIFEYLFWKALPYPAHYFLNSSFTGTKMSKESMLQFKKFLLVVTQ